MQISTLTIKTDNHAPFNKYFVKFNSHNTKTFIKFKIMWFISIWDLLNINLLRKLLFVSFAEKEASISPDSL